MINNVCTVLTNEKCMYGTRGGGGDINKNKKNPEIYQAINFFFGESYSYIIYNVFILKWCFQWGTAGGSKHT